jgi:hypothetical protein
VHLHRYPPTHPTVDHPAREYVRGDVHTNTIEDAFGLFKRGLVGSSIRCRASISTATWTNSSSATTTRNPYLFRDTPQKLVTTEAMPYEQLTA